MDYRAVGDRCAVILESLNLPVCNEEALRILAHQGFEPIEVDIIRLSRACVGVSRYRRGARPDEAPDIVDCSSFIKWLYGQRGIWLPRRSIQQRALGELVSLDGLKGGDVVFVSGWKDYHYGDPSDGVGHVGIATGEDTVVHASDNKVGIVETSLSDFISREKFRGVRRYIPKNTEVLTFKTPHHRGIETADDLRWVVLQSL